MHRVLMIAGLASLLADQASAGRLLRIVDNVQPVCDPEKKGPARLVVHVVDHEGRSMEGIAVEAVRAGGQRERRAAKTDHDGLARLDFEGEGKGGLRVTSTFTGFFTSVAERVHVRNGCLAGLTLPMQVEVPKDNLTERQQREGAIGQALADGR